MSLQYLVVSRRSVKIPPPKQLKFHENCIKLTGFHIRIIVLKIERSSRKALDFMKKIKISSGLEMKAFAKDVFINQERKLVVQRPRMAVSVAFWDNKDFGLLGKYGSKAETQRN